MNIYKIDESIQALFSPETGELIEGAEEQLAALTMERTDKIHNLLLGYKNVARLADGIAAEVKTLTERLTAERRKQARLLDLIQYATNGQDYTFPDAELSRRRNPPSVEVTDTEACLKWLDDNGHGDCIKRKPPEVSVNDLKALLRQGVAVPGAQLQQKERMVVR